MKAYRLVRFGLGRNSTLGYLARLEDDTEERLCFTLEDERRETKVPGETCIPVGTYEVVLYKAGRKHEHYARKFGARHKGMLLLKDVKGFEGIEIHPGNYETDTDGCILPGTVPAIYPDGEFYVGRSTDAYWLIYEEIVPALVSGEKVVLHITEIQPWA